MHRHVTNDLLMHGNPKITGVCTSRPVPTLYADNYASIWADRPLPTLAVGRKTYTGTNRQLLIIYYIL